MLPKQEIHNNCEYLHRYSPRIGREGSFFAPISPHHIPLDGIVVVRLGLVRLGAGIEPGMLVPRNPALPSTTRTDHPGLVLCTRGVVA